MSTKCSIDSNDDDLTFPPFHLYWDAASPEAGVFLEIADCSNFTLHFEATHESVTLRIPTPLWERLKAGKP